MSRRRSSRTPPPPPPIEPRPGFVAVGFVLGPRGVQGELKVALLSDVAERFAPGRSLWAAGVRYSVERARLHKDSLLLTLVGIGSRQAAEALRGQLLEVPEGELAPLGEGEYFRFQILGMEVLDASGRSLGRIEEILATGSNDVYMVRGPQGEWLLPAIDEVVKEVDVAAKRMVVELLEGMEARPGKHPRKG